MGFAPLSETTAGLKSDGSNRHRCLTKKFVKNVRYPCIIVLIFWIGRCIVSVTSVEKGKMTFTEGQSFAGKRLRSIPPRYFFNSAKIAGTTLFNSMELNLNYRGCSNEQQNTTVVSQQKP